MWVKRDVVCCKTYIRQSSSFLKALNGGSTINVLAGCNSSGYNAGDCYIGAFSLGNLIY